MRDLICLLLTVVLGTGASTMQVRAASGDIPIEARPIAFVDATEVAGIDFTHFNATRASLIVEDVGSGAAWGDYDNDGWEDLYVCNIAGPLLMDPALLANRPGSRLYRNLGGGRFRDVSADARVDHVGWDMACVWADYDNDGWLDLLVTGHDAVTLYHNEADGTFSDATTPAGMADIRGTCLGPAWGDVDGDGFLDVYIPRYIQFPMQTARNRPTVAGRPAPMTTPSDFPPDANLLLRNNGDGTFSDIEHAMGGERVHGRSMQAVFSDFDNDGRVDLYVANDQSFDRLYRNLGDGAFEDVSLLAGTADRRAGMGIALGDVDNNGWMDMFITHWVGEDDVLYRNLLDGEGEFYELGFQDVTPEAGLLNPDLSLVGWGTGLIDFDNDGFLDLFVAYGSTVEDELTLDVLTDPKLLPQRNYVYRGSASGRFHLSAEPGEFSMQKRVSRGVAFADYDHDGRVDAFIVNHNEQPTLLRNTTLAGNWVDVRLVGRETNHSGIGARVTIGVNGTMQWREIIAGESYLSGNTTTAHFGLGNALRIEWIEVRWPTGKMQRVQNLTANRTIVIREASEE